MKSVEKIVKDLDEKVDSWGKRFFKHFKRYFPIFSIVLLLSLLILFLFRTYQEKPLFISSVISNDIEMIVKALNKIDKRCNILSVKNDRNYVDFLNVEKFVGSEVGCLNLAFPKKWDGPYVYDNPTIEGKMYEIIRFGELYFVLPGRGVKLPNGLVVGKDFDYDSAIKIDEMLDVGGCLNFEGQSLGEKLKFEVGDWDSVVEEETLQSLNEMLEEFNAAMPFTYNQTGTTSF